MAHESKHNRNKGKKGFSGKGKLFFLFLVCLFVILSVSAILVFAGRVMKKNPPGGRIERMDQKETRAEESMGQTGTDGMPETDISAETDGASEKDAVREEKTEESDAPAAGNGREAEIQFANGDVIFAPSHEAIAYDEDSCMIYYNNLLLVYTFTDLGDNEAQELADSVDGEVVGDISGIVNLLQIRVEAQKPGELDKLAEQLMQSEQVLYASFDFPVQMASCTEDPWCPDPESENPDRGDEQNLPRNDWWAEAIGAYTAWEYSEQCQPFRVGILDTGFDTDHEDLEGKIEFLPDYSSNTEDDHGTMVAGIIGAAGNNGIGIRGVADKAAMVCADWSPGEDTTLFDNAVYIEVMKQMVESGVKVINNSWGYHYQSEAGFIFDTYWSGNGYFNDMTDYGIRLRNSREGTGFDRELYFPGNSYTNAEFYINQKKVSVDTFRKETADGSFIRYCEENGEITKIFFIRDDYGYLREYLAELFCGSYVQYRRCVETYCRRTAMESIQFMVQLLLNDQRDFLIIQGAGNGYDNGGPGLDARNSGHFCSITEEIYNSLGESVREGLKQKEIDYRALEERILIVSAVENRKNENGEYLMTQFANYGDAVDICAPGMDVLTTSLGNTYELVPGTSMAAPVVSGSAALLWSLKPELTAPQVREYLLNCTNSRARGVGDGAGYVYPVVDVGTAVQVVMGDYGKGSFTPSQLPEDAVEYNGHYYHVYETPEVTNGREAEEYCRARNGYLAVISSAQEDAFLFQFMKDSGYESAYFGYSDSREEGNWHWLNFEQSEYTNWHAGEPNSENPDEDYAMYYTGFPDGTWNDGDFGHRTVNSGRAFICEWGDYMTASR